MKIKKEGLENYTINEMGEIFTLKGKKRKTRIQCGYETINISNKTYLIHRLIGLTFIPNPENKPCINHKNGDKLNNSINNLEWVTYSENMKHAFINKLVTPSCPMKGKLGKDHSKSKIILQLDLQNNILNEFYGSGEAHRKTGVSLCGIQHTLTGRQKTSKGFKWRYKNDN